MSLTSSVERRQLTWFLAVVAALRIVIVLIAHRHYPEGALNNDSSGYLDPARAMLQDKAYLTAPGSGDAEFLRTPGYPTFLAASLWVGSHRIGVILVVQALVSVVTVALTYLLARRVGLSHFAGLGAASLLTLDVYHAALAGSIQTETLAALGTTIVALLAMSVMEQPGRARLWALFGLSIAICAFVRPTMYYFPVIVAAVGVVGAWRARANPKRVAVAALAFLLPISTLIIYSARNQVEFGSSSFTSAEAITNYWYRAGWNVSIEDGKPWDPDSRAKLTKELVPELTDEEALEYRNGTVVPPQWAGSTGDYYDEANRRAWRILLGNPVLSARQFVRGLYSQATNTGWISAANILGVARVPRPVDYFSRLLVLALNAMALAGIAITALTKDRRAIRLAPAMIAAYVVFVSAGNQAVAGARMRSPITPILSVFVMVAATATVRRYRSRSVAAGASHSSEDP